jgi:hypothetical protein
MLTRQYTYVTKNIIFKLFTNIKGKLSLKINIGKKRTIYNEEKSDAFVNFSLERKYTKLCLLKNFKERLDFAFIKMYSVYDLNHV